MLVNIGGGSISEVVISLSGIVSYATERKGSKMLDNTIVRYLRDNHNFNIGDQKGIAREPFLIKYVI